MQKTGELAGTAGITKEYTSIPTFRLAFPPPLKGARRCTGMYKYRERRDAVSGQGGGSISNSPAGYRDNKYSYVDKYYLEQKIKKQPASDSAA
jgi:hypothetical protein